jgi:tRNA(fMet)-specific endonuclease VapC
MLNTDTVGFALQGVGDVAKRILRHKPSRLCISAITLMELRYGVEKKRSPRLGAIVEAFVRGISVCPFNDAAAHQFGKVTTEIGAGAPLGALDSLIAAHALSMGTILVTNNRRHFEQIAGLRLENWL